MLAGDEVEDDDGGDDMTDQARAFRAEAVGAGDCASAARVAQDGAEGVEADDAAFTYSHPDRRCPDT